MHIDELLNDVAKLQLCFGDWANVMTIPPSAKAQLRWDLRIVPFLSGDNFSAAVEAKCAEKGVGIVRSSGEGFLVKAAAAAALAGAGAGGGPPGSTGTAASPL